MGAKSDGEWQGLFNALESFQVEKLQQKQKGLNDFSALSSVLSVNDEVRLHTRFIYALLNPESTHYMGSQFLELFLRCLGHAEWLDLSSAVVRKEFCPVGQSEQIDLYITDGNRQIVIENKLNAQDQPRQAQRYLQAVGTAGSAGKTETLFVYLTKGRKTPSPLSLGSLSLSSDMKYILDGSGKRVARYQALRYSRRSQSPCIHNWLDACLLTAQGRQNIA